MIRGWRPIEQIAAGLMLLYLASLVAVHPLRHGSVGLARACAFWVVLSIAVWRLVKSQVTVDEGGIDYRGFMRNRKIDWRSVDGFTYSTSGVTVFASGVHPIWLMPTKPIRARRKRAIAEAEATLRSIVDRAPERDGFVVTPPRG